MNHEKINHIYFKLDDNQYRVLDPYTNYGTLKTVSYTELKLLKKRYEMFDKNFFFNYSRDNVYTHYSLLDAIKHQQEFNIKINLNNDLEHNAYLYEDSDLIYTKDVFGTWFNELNAFKQKHPKNKLIKHLMK
jgi:hypothetical protein